MNPDCPPYVSGSGLTRVPRTPLTPEQAAGLKVLERQRRLTSWPYYSKVKFFAQTEDVPPGPYSWELRGGTEVRAFSYGVQQPMQSAGFTTADGNATVAETNLTNRNQTTGGQNVLIHGIALQLMPSMSHIPDGGAAPAIMRPVDYQFASAIWNNVSVELALNGDENTFRLGVPGMLPGAGGLSGGAPDLAGRVGEGAGQKDIEFPTNGWPVRSNFFRVPEGLIWRNQSNADSMVNVIFRVRRGITILSGGSPENNIAVTGQDVAANLAQNQLGYIFPQQLVCGIMVFLVGEVLGPRTRSA